MDKHLEQGDSHDQPWLLSTQPHRACLFQVHTRSDLKPVSQCIPCRPARAQLNKLQASIGGRQTHGVSAHSPGTAAYSSSRLNKSTTQKMAAKYGDYTDEFNKKSWWRFGK